jgi:Na+/H+ antiporter
MLDHFPFYLSLVILIVLLIMLSNKIKVAYPVLLVLGGLAVSFIPNIPDMKIDPELIFIIFLPPLLYEAAWTNSWKELWHWRRIIGSFAFIVVFFTAITVALFANAIIPGFSLALGFLLGGIVSPPDAVSASAILKFVKAPKRMSSILEGESLLNDASSLIIFRFAMAAVATGQFVLYQAALSFFWIIIGGIAIGLMVGLLFLKAHKWLPTDVNMDIILTLVTPYAMYISAEAVHASGVLAVVSGGLFLSNFRHHFLTGASRLSGETVWRSLIFILNGLVFLLIGLDLPEILSALQKEGISFYRATGYALFITLVLILGRILAAYGALIVTLFASHFIKVAEKNPGLKAPLLLGWTGMRGVVSLAAALSIPMTLANEVPFPHRNLILYITFVVILITLVLQGLTLPALIKRVNLPDFKDHLPEEETQKLIKEALAKESLNYLTENYKAELDHSPHLQKLANKWEDQMISDESPEMSLRTKTIYGIILEKQRHLLLQLNKKDKHIDEDIIRKFLHQIDLEEERLKVE